MIISSMLLVKWTQVLSPFGFKVTDEPIVNTLPYTWRTTLSRYSIVPSCSKWHTNAKSILQCVFKQLGSARTRSVRVINVHQKLQRNAAQWSGAGGRGEIFNLQSDCVPARVQGVSSVLKGAL